MVRIDAERVRYEVSRRGLTLTEFAKQAGISPTTLSRCLRTGRVWVTTHQRLTAAMTRLPVTDAHQLVKREVA